MPIPKTRKIGSTIQFLKRDKPGMARKQKVAIALSTARRAGANIPKRPGNPIAAEVKERAKIAKKKKKKKLIRT